MRAPSGIALPIGAGGIFVVIHRYVCTPALNETEHVVVHRSALGNVGLSQTGIVAVPSFVVIARGCPVKVGFEQIFQVGRGVRHGGFENCIRRLMIMRYRIAIIGRIIRIRRVRIIYIRLQILKAQGIDVAHPVTGDVFILVHVIGDMAIVILTVTRGIAHDWRTVGIHRRTARQFINARKHVNVLEVHRLQAGLRLGSACVGQRFRGKSASKLSFHRLTVFAGQILTRQHDITHFGVLLIQRHPQKRRRRSGLFRVVNPVVAGIVAADILQTAYRALLEQVFVINHMGLRRIDQSRVVI